MKTIKDIFSKIIKFILKITGDDLSIYAAQASFFIIISVIPFSMLVLSIIKLFINIDINSILHTINSFAPAAISTFLTETITDLFTKSGSVQVISVTAVSTLWLASRGVMALYTGLNKVYRSRSKNYFIGRLISILYTLAFIAALILTIVFFGFGSKLEYFINSHSPFFSTLLDFFLRGKILIFMIYLTFVFALFYKFLPKKDNRFKAQLPGATFSAVGWMVFSFFYSIYIEHFSNYSFVYGSLAAIVFLMLWLYFCMNIFLFGAQINKMIEDGFFQK